MYRGLVSIDCNYLGSKQCSSQGIIKLDTCKFLSRQKMAAFAAEAAVEAAAEAAAAAAL